jgi:hypothetical protein
MSTKKKGRPEHDWDSIRQEYIATNISTKELAKKHKVRLATLSEKCSKEHWVAKRKEYKKRLSEKTSEKLCSKMATKKANEFAEILDLTGLAQKRLHEMLQKDNLKTSDVRNIMESLEIAERVTRNITGAPTLIQAHRIKMETERLELDKKKADAQETDKDIKVVIKGYEKEWCE